MELSISKRKGKSKSEISHLRTTGHIPAVLYAPGAENENISITNEELQNGLKHIPQGRLSNTVITLKEGKQVRKALIKEIQYHRTSYQVLHVDFMLISEDKPVNLNIPIECVGEDACAGIKLGGFLRRVIRAIKVNCLPKDIPEKFEIDIRNLNITDSVKLKDLAIPKGVRPLAGMEQVAVVIAKR